MTTRTALAAGALAIVGVAGLSTAAVTTDVLPLAASDTTTTVTVTTPIPPCSAITARGMVNNPCAVELTKWNQEFRNGLGTASYYAKWKAGNPGEYGRLKTWGTSAATTPQPVVATGFGAVVRYGLDQCRTWAIDLANCLLP